MAVTDPYTAPVAPSTVLEWVRDQRATQALDSAEAVTGGVIPTGSRNNLLTSFAGLLRRHGGDDELVARILTGLNNQVTEEPLPQDEVAAIVRSSARWEQETSFELVDDTDWDDDEPEVSEGADTQPPKQPKPAGQRPWLIKLSKMEMPGPVQWLWNPYLARGEFALLDGLEGIGKGMFSTYAVVQNTGGGFGTPSPALWMSTEDDPTRDIQKRLKAAGWSDKTHEEVYFFDRWPQFPANMDVLEQALQATGAKLVIMDPGRSFLRRQDGAPMSYNDEVAIREPMELLMRLGREYDATILFIHHWNKDSQGSTRSRAGGSGGFVQVVRHRISTAKAGSGDSSEWAFQVTKSNITQDGHLRAYTLEAHESIDTAVFKLGPKITDYPDLGTWMKKREAAIEGGTVSVYYDEVMEQELARRLEPGGNCPPRDWWVKNKLVPEKQYSEALADLVERGIVEKVSHNGGLTRYVYRGSQS